MYNQTKHTSYDNRHLHRFFKMNCAPLLMQLKVFPNIKEITESVGAYIAIHDHLLKKVINREEGVQVFVVGDGKTPRTGALIACLTKWNVHSIDPVMEEKYWEIRRLKTYRAKAEELSFEGKEKQAIVVCVHSHAQVSSCLKMLKGFTSVHFVNIPCCFDSDIDKKPDISYIDMGIQSQKQRVDVFLNCNH